LDAGDIILQKKIPILEEDNFLSLHDKLAILGAETLTESINLIERGRVERSKQEKNQVIMVKPFTKEDTKIDWKKSEREIFNFTRALDPTPGAYTTIHGKVLKIFHVKENFRQYPTAQIGEVVDFLKKEGPVIKTGNGSVVVTSAKPENKNKLTGNDLMNGRFLKIGDLLL
jgi:methionyl-tRNA formyltransferase